MEEITKCTQSPKKKDFKADNGGNITFLAEGTYSFLSLLYQGDQKPRLVRNHIATIGSLQSFQREEE